MRLVGPADYPESLPRGAAARALIGWPGVARRQVLRQDGSLLPFPITDTVLRVAGRNLLISVPTKARGRLASERTPHG